MKKPESLCHLLSLLLPSSRTPMTIPCNNNISSSLIFLSRFLFPLFSVNPIFVPFPLSPFWCIYQIICSPPHPPSLCPHHMRAVRKESLVQFERQKRQARSSFYIHSSLHVFAFPVPINLITPGPADVLLYKIIYIYISNEYQLFYIHSYILCKSAICKICLRMHYVFSHVQIN